MMYEVKYKVNNSYYTKHMNLQGGMESEAINQLYSSYTVPRSQQIVIMSIRPL